MNIYDCPVMQNCLKWVSAYCDMLVRIEREELRNEKRKQKRRLKRNIRNSHVKIKYHQLVNEHYASHCLADEAAKLLKEAATYLHQLDSLIKESKNQRRKCKKDRQYKRSDEITKLISKLSEMYFEIKKDRDNFLDITRTLNKSTATLNHRIRNCGHQGQKWYQRQQQRLRFRN